MSVYAIGDLQGCLAPLERLLDRLRFDPTRDQLWLAGDLVNRGPDSLAVLRYVMALGAAAVSVVGNHDLHLLARAGGGRAGRLDTLEEILHAPDRQRLLDWLRCQPLLHEGQGATAGWAMAHAGIAPCWDLAQARAAAREVEALLQGESYTGALARMYGDEPRLWADAASPLDRLRFTLNAFTRMRFCHPDGALEFRAKGRPGKQPPGLQPWFTLPVRKPLGVEVVFGHWSQLGQVHWPAARVWGLDTGAVWGGRLTALNLETRELTAVECPENQSPDGGGD